MAETTSKPVIWKYPLEVGTNSIDIAKGARVLTVHENQGDLTLWALVDSGGTPERRRFVVVGTGWILDSQLGTQGAYIGSAHIGGFVWHVFEIFYDPS